MSCPAGRWTANWKSCTSTRLLNAAHPCAESGGKHRGGEGVLCRVNPRHDEDTEMLDLQLVQCRRIGPAVLAESMHLYICFGHFRLSAGPCRYIDRRSAVSNLRCTQRTAHQVGIKQHRSSQHHRAKVSPSCFHHSIASLLQASAGRRHLRIANTLLNFCELFAQAPALLRERSRDLPHKSASPSPGLKLRCCAQTLRCAPQPGAQLDLADSFALSHS